MFIKLKATDLPDNDITFSGSTFMDILQILYPETPRNFLVGAGEGVVKYVGYRNILIRLPQDSQKHCTQTKVHLRSNHWEARLRSPFFCWLIGSFCRVFPAISCDLFYFINILVLLFKICHNFMWCCVILPPFQNTVDCFRNPGVQGSFHHICVQHEATRIMKYKLWCI